MKFEMEIVGGDEGDIALGLWSVHSQIEDEGAMSGTQRVNDKSCTWRIKR